MNARTIQTIVTSTETLSR